MKKKDVDFTYIATGLLLVSLSIVAGLTVLTPYLPEDVSISILRFIGYVVIVAGVVVAIPGLFVIGCCLIIDGLKEK